MPTLALFEETSLLQTAPLLERLSHYPTAASLREHVLLLGGLDTFLFGTPHSTVFVADARRAEALAESTPFLNAKGRAKKEEEISDEDDDDEDFDDEEDDDEDEDDYDDEDLAGLGEFDEEDDEDSEDEDDIEFEDFDEEDFDLEDDDDDDDF
ncbi:MAG: hypothetical protein EAZ92_16290 [Candidatus Kapaibacterium sp.]|nr:MAG: hypothetical protein EAZ92_16290 [Candidatus Kapabacteria bacterium]